MDTNLIDEITNSVKDLTGIYFELPNGDLTEFEHNLSSELETTLIGLVKSLRIAAFKMSDSL
jgi:hypothetical protein